MQRELSQESAFVWYSLGRTSDDCVWKQRYRDTYIV